MTIQSTVFDWLQAHPGPHSVDAVADSIDFERSQVVNAAYLLDTKGLLTRRSSGIYEVAPIVTTSKITSTPVLPSVVLNTDDLSPEEESDMDTVEDVEFSDEPVPQASSSFGKTAVQLRLERMAIFLINDGSDQENVSVVVPSDLTSRWDSRFDRAIKSVNEEDRLKTATRSQGDGTTRVYFVKR